MKELKPCPFCNGSAYIIRMVPKKVYGADKTVKTVYGVKIYCDCCNAEMFYMSEKLAIEAWNRRTNKRKGESE